LLLQIEEKIVEEIRGEDFRKSWPNALSRALCEVSELSEALDQQRREVVELAYSTPRMVKKVENLMAVSINQYIDAIDAAQRKLLQQQEAMLKGLAQERVQLDHARYLIDQRQADLIEKERAFADVRQQFNNMSVWSRIFTRA
jgi:transcriptional regulator with AAA-type ATPase domain